LVQNLKMAIDVQDFVFEPLDLRHNLSQSDELQFFKQIEPIIKKKYNCEVKVLIEHKSESKK